VTSGGGLGYFDTSALMRWLEGDVANPKEMNSRIRPMVEQILSGTDRLAISEMTIVELLSNVTHNWRNQDPQCQPFDDAWAGRSRQRFMSLIADGRLEVIPVPTRAIEHAIAILDLAASEHQLRVGVQDAVHMITACAWAYREAAAVRFYTSDDDYNQLTDAYPQYLRFAKVVNLEALTRPAADPAPAHRESDAPRDQRR
jgi:predicted nucleic acid-binding protein